MNYKICDIRNENSIESAQLLLYLLDDSPEMEIHKRPVIVICPGGGYKYLSDREAEIIAIQYAAMGYHAAVLKYSTSPAVFPTALLELGKSVMLLRNNAEKWNIDEEKIVVSGFSAGGHLAAGYGVFWSRDFVCAKLDAEPEVLRPNAMILCYPVITSGEFAHDDSFRKLLGKEYEEKKESVSIEHCVNSQTPRTFIWHTYEDSVVPVQNSLLLVNELVRQKIPVEFHMFERGGHGLALANRLTQTGLRVEVEDSAAEWINLVHLWLEKWIDGTQAKQMPDDKKSTCL
ncbi:MAG: alpha/beta hydrolase [Lachnospiraceae bacterium]|nr:alpha/beta hydrolase [Lachnospiraceae bacterium]